MAISGQFTRGEAKVIVSDYRYFFDDKKRKEPQKIRRKCKFLIAD